MEKQLKASTFDPGWSRELAWEEAYVLGRCRGRPHIVQFLDVCMTFHQEGVMHLAMDPRGRDLRHWQTVDSNAFGPHNLRDVFSQIVDGMTYLHTGLGLLHCDLKLHSVLAKQLSDGLYAVKVADLGSAAEANPMF